MTSRASVAWCIALSIGLAPPAAGSVEVTRFQNAETKLKGWRLADEGVEIELIQRLPIQTRAFFEARGLSLDAAREVGETCVMQTIVRNTHDAGSGIALRVDFKSWSLEQGGDVRPVLTNEAFLDRWSTDAANDAARVAFRWATFPTSQTFLPGDYIWGMTMLGAQPGTVVDLRLSWRMGEAFREAWVRGIECAADRQ